MTFRGPPSRLTLPLRYFIGVLFFPLHSTPLPSIHPFGGIAVVVMGNISTTITITITATETNLYSKQYGRCRFKEETCFP